MDNLNIDLLNDNGRASSGYFSTSNQYIVFWIECIQNSQNISNNTSNVTVKVWVKRTNTGYTTYGSGTVYCAINGASYSASITTSQKITSTPIVLFQKTLDIGHNADGTKTLGMSAAISHDRFSSDTGIYNQVLTTIPRVSNFTLNTTNFTLGETTVVVNIQKASTSFTHKVYYRFGTINWLAMSSGDSSVSFVPNISDCSQIPNSTSGVGDITVETWNGSTKIGQKSIGFTANVPSSVKPSFTKIIAELVSGGLNTSYGYIQNKSRCKLTLQGESGSYGSTITNYSISGGGYSSNSVSSITNTITQSGDITFTGYVVDSRGRKSDTKTVTINVTPYNTPRVLEFTAVRCLINGEMNEDGTYAKVSTAYSYSTVNGKNKLTAKLSYKKTGDTNYVDCSQSPSADGSVVIGDGKFDTISAYDIKITLQDTISDAVTQSLVLATSYVTMDFRKGGKGVAFGKISDVDGFVVDMNATFNKSLIAKNGVDCAMDYAPNVSYEIPPKGLSIIQGGNDGLSQGFFSNYVTALNIKHSNDRQFQIGTHCNGTDIRFRSSHINNSNGDATGWSSWQKIYHTGNKPTPSEIGALPTTLAVHNGAFTINENNKQLIMGCGIGDVFFKNSKSESYLQFSDDNTLRINGLVIGNLSYPIIDRDTNRWHSRIAPIMGDGVMEVGRYIDFHKDNSSGADYTVRLDANGSSLWCSTSITQASDRNLKEDIIYLDDNTILPFSERDESLQFKDFIKEFKFATYKYKGADGTKFGFIAQDVYDSPVGRLMVTEQEREIIDKKTNTVSSDTEKILSFDISAYTTVVAKALQEEIREKDSKIADLEERLAKLEQMVSDMVR